MFFFFFFFFQIVISKYVVEVYYIILQNSDQGRISHSKYFCMKSRIIHTVHYKILYSNYQYFSLSIQYLVISLRASGKKLK